MYRETPHPLSTGCLFALTAMRVESSPFRHGPNSSSLGRSKFSPVTAGHLASMKIEKRVEENVRVFKAHRFQARDSNVYLRGPPVMIDAADHLLRREYALPAAPVDGAPQG